MLPLILCWIRKSNQSVISSDEFLTDLTGYFMTRFIGKDQFRARAKFNHPKLLPGLQMLTRFQPADNPTGDLPGTTQAAAIEAHEHTVYRRPTFVSGGTMPLIYPHTVASAYDTPTAETGGPETRPTNIAMMFFMALG